MYLQIHEVLGHVEAFVAQLQADDAPLAIYAPLSAAFKAVLRELSGDNNTHYAVGYLKEFEACEQRHFEVSKVCGNWASYRELFETASLAHPLYRQGLFMDDTTRLKRRHRFQQHMLTMYMRRHNITDPNVMVGPSPTQQAPKASDKKRQRLPGAASLFAKVSSMNNLGSPGDGEACIPATQQAHPEGGDVAEAGVAQPRRSLKEEIVHLSDAWFAADPDAAALHKVFTSTQVRKNFRLLYPGLKSLLQHSASNGTIERLFSKLSRSMSKLQKNLNAEDKLCLNINSQFLDLDGYQHRFELGRDSDTEEEPTFADSFYSVFDD